MEAQGGSGGAIAATAHTETCPRCGNFAALQPQLGRSFCAPCWLRVIEPGVSVAQVLGDVRRLAMKLLPRSWLSLILINLPLTAGEALYKLGTSKDLPLPVSSGYYFATLAAVGAILYASHRVLLGDQNVDWGEAWRASTKRLGAMIGATWLSGLITLAFTLLLVVPGILRGLSYFLTTPIALHESWTTSDTLKQSMLRTRGRRPAIFGSGLAVFAIGFIPTLFLLGVFGALVGVASHGALTNKANVLINVASELAIQGPFALIYFTTASLYVRCSVRHDEPAAPAEAPR